MPDLTPVEWLTGLVLEAASLEDSRRTQTVQGQITSPSGRSYQVLQKLGATGRYNLYLCLLPNGSTGVLKIAASGEQNSLLDKEALIMRLMSERAEEVERKRDPTQKPFNYQYFFPNLFESFLSESQGGRRVNILSFPEEVESLTQLTPLTELTEKEQLRVDPKTAAWILGKTLKVLAFAHDQGISNGLVVGSNILIEKAEHGVLLFDWTMATIHPGGTTPTEVCKQEITQAANAAIKIMGGDKDTQTIPSSDQLVDNRFELILQQMVRGGFSSASTAHDSFYKLIYELWPRGFHHFTTYKLNKE